MHFISFNVKAYLSDLILVTTKTFPNLIKMKRLCEFFYELEKTSFCLL